MRKFADRGRGAPGGGVHKRLTAARTPQTNKPVKESGLSASCRCLLSARHLTRFDVAVDQQVRAWPHKHRHDPRNRETSQDGSCQRGIYANESSLQFYVAMPIRVI